MAKGFKLRDRTGEKSIQAFLQEKRIEQQQVKQFLRLERAKNVRLRDIETESYYLRQALASYGRGMTKLSSYFKKEKNEIDKNTIWFPLERSRTDWEPRPCWIGESAVNQERCLHFPCRNFTSYHFLHRELPKWVLDQAEESVQMSKNDEETLETNNDKGYDSKTKSCNNALKLPALDFPENMTAKERKLKIIISKKRLQNELENKPTDRCINYGKPTPVRRLQRPVRPCVRRMDTRS